MEKLLQPKPHMLHFSSLSWAWSALLETAHPFVDVVPARNGMCAPGRFYHDWHHCARMWDTWCYYSHDNDTLRDLGSAIAVATLYHDAVYDPKALPGVNEQESADLLLANKAVRLGELVGMPYNMIVATGDHWKPYQRGFQQIFCDLDLFSLCLRWDEFAFNNFLIRQEYAHKIDQEFRHGQVELFRAWRMMGSGIYRSELLPPWCESAAQTNLQRAISLLHANIAPWVTLEKEVD